MLGSRLVPLVALAALPFGCATSTTTATALPPPTAISISPLDFLGGVACSDAPGAMQSYVATITDITSEEGVFTLPSSPPTGCASPVSFRYVIPGHRYRAEIDGYELPPEKLVPFGGKWTGARQMRSVETGNVEPARWATSCADEPTTSAVAAFDQNVFVTGCQFIQDRGSSLTGIELDFSTLLGQLQCGPALAGDVTTLDVLPEDPSIAPAKGVSCDLGKLFFQSGIVPGSTYGFGVEVRAFEGGPVTLGARCVAQAEEGLTVRATCDLLTPDGAVRFDVAPLLLKLGLKCADSVAFAVTVGGTSSAPVPCTQTLRMGPFPSGPTTATLTVTQSGAAAKTASCTALVVPGTTADANCTPN